MAGLPLRIYTDDVNTEFVNVIKLSCTARAKPNACPIEIGLMSVNT